MRFWKLKKYHFASLAGVLLHNSHCVVLNMLKRLDFIVVILYLRALYGALISTHSHAMAVDI